MGRRRSVHGGVPRRPRLPDGARLLRADPPGRPRWPSSRSASELLRKQYQAVFVDEYQDTDPSQVRLLQALAGDGRDLVVVGDPDQSIYAFRGADVRGILEFPTQFPRPTAARRR
ncbi:MAG: UvrD-helicase domain-containing protein [Nocardioidaceae bacterium]